jgi:hypothetical protein
LLEQKSATPETLVQLLSDLIEKPAVRGKMRSALAQWHAPHAAEQIAETMLLAVEARADEGRHTNPQSAVLPGSRTGDTRDIPEASGPPQAGLLQISDLTARQTALSGGRRA